MTPRPTEPPSPTVRTTVRAAAATAVGGTVTPTGALLRANVEVLGQCLAILDRVDAETYGTARPELGLSGPGPHVRHVVDFYDRLLEGLDVGRVDYDERRRDPRVETDPSAARAALRRVVASLEALPAEDRVLESRGDGSPWCSTTLARELVSLASHAVHHYALIGVALRHAGIEPPEEFGVAPSTLRHWREACAR